MFVAKFISIFVFPGYDNVFREKFSTYGSENDEAETNQEGNLN